MPAAPAPDPQQPTGAWTVFLLFLRLGLTSFGGPIAHLGYFRDEFVRRRRWLSEAGYAELVALCQFLPGPASSQVGMALGLLRAGYRGALAAWLGFTLPSAALLMLFGSGLAGATLAPAALHGLKLVAVAVVAQAVWGMGRTLCTDAPRIVLMLLAAGAALALPAAWTQVAIIAAAAVAGALLLQTPAAPAGDGLPPTAPTLDRRAAFGWLAAFAILLLGLPLLAHAFPGTRLALLTVFYRAGALVFGGGHVVLPLLQAELVPTGWIGNDAFLAGYGAAQAVPGPLFSFAAFLGAAIGGWRDALLALMAIFLPGFLLVAGALPFWRELRRNRRARAALAGVNAAVVGLLLAALYRPLATSAVHQAQDFALVLLALAALTIWKLPPWLVVLGCALSAWLWLPA